MRAKRFWAVRSFITCFFWNAVLVAVLFYLAKQVVDGLQLWLNPFLESGAETLPADLRTAFGNMNGFLSEVETYLAPVIFGLGGLATLVLWLFMLFQGRGLATRAFQEALSSAQEPEKTATVEQEKELEPPEPKYVQSSPQAAVQMLAVLQREGRLLDFLEEDLSQYDDVQIGAAVRSIHNGCKQALKEYVELKPIFEESEGAEVIVAEGFDSRAIRLIGNVTGDPPFKGTLRHRGWRVKKVTLPQPTSEQEKDWVLAPAEIEMT